MKKKLLVVIVLFLEVIAMNGQDYLGIYINRNVVPFTISGNNTSVPTLWFAENTNRGVAPTAGDIGVSAQYSGQTYPALAEPATSPSTNPHSAMMFGGQSNNTEKSLLSKTIIVSMNDVGTPSNSYYTPVSGINSMPVTEHYAFENYVSTEGLLNDGLATDGSYAMGNITYTFTSPVDNPIFHVTGLGGFFSAITSEGVVTQLFSTDLVFVSGGGANSISRLSGTSHTVLAGNTISNSYTSAEYFEGGTEGVAGDDAGSGSYLITGTDITSVTFNVIMVGKVVDQDWSTLDAESTQKYTGDRFNTTWTLETTVLPINLLSFNATKNTDVANLDWSTASEVNFSHFDVESSSNGINFTKIGAVSAKGEDSKYTFVDEHPLEGINYYRLKSIDNDGSYDYSKIEAVDFNRTRSNMVKVFPNPTSQQFTMAGLPADANIRVFDMSGRLIESRSSIKNQVQHFSLDDQNAGIYLLEVRTNTSVETHKLIKVH